MAQGKATPEGAADDGPLSPAGVKALKFAIVAMGVMIIVGLVLMVGRIIYLASKPKPAKTAATAVTTLAAEVSVWLPPATRAKHLALDGDRLSVLYEGDGGSGAIVIDLTRGKTISSITFKSGGGASGTQTK